MNIKEEIADLVTLNKLTKFFIRVGKYFEI